MDIHLQTNPQLHFRVNGGANSRSSEDEALQFLSQEEQECIQFFEETIDSLEDSLNEEERPVQETVLAQTSSKADGPTSFPAQSSPIPGSSSASIPGPSFLPPMADRHISPKDQDIIDLVQPEPDLVQTKGPAFVPTMPDFQSMVRHPDSHFEVMSKRDLMDTLPSEYNPPLPNSSYAPDSLSYHPPGSVPTPVMIAQKIAENQGSGPTNLNPSAILRHRSLDFDKPPSCIDHPSKQGPPTFTKPNRFPSNISVMLGSKESHNQSLANVNIHERREQMLSNLTGTCHPLEEHESPEKGRNVPTRSVSFRDPTPDKSRMEALSKLGLNRNRAMSGDSGSTPIFTTDTGTSLNPPIPAIPTPPPSQTLAETRPETVLPDPISSPGDKTIKANPSPPRTVTQSTYHPPPAESWPPPPPEVASLDFNTYGGKTIAVNPSASNKSEPSVTAGSHDSKAHPSVMASPSDFNSYGGKSKVMTHTTPTTAPAPAPVSITRSDLPDILSSHIDKSRVPSSPTAAPVKPEMHPYELNSYGGKTRSITPSRSSNPTSHSLGRTPKAPAPSPAPRPNRSFHGPLSPQKAVGRPPSPEPRRRSISKPAAFRSQGITVQFSGRGATDESRREALRKLGLLKDTC